jgi:hypothetical protein
MFSGRCIFYDHASGYIHVEFQVLLNVNKTRFEQALFTYGIMVHSYHSDNGVFAAQTFAKEIEDNFKIFKFSGAYAHHQNGATECLIGTLFNYALTMLLHSKIRWNEVIDSYLWPMAVEYARWVYNHMLRDTDIAPIDVLNKGKNQRGTLINAHVFGCPGYVLDPKLQNGASLPKFVLDLVEVSLLVSVDVNHHWFQW